MTCAAPLNRRLVVGPRAFRLAPATACKHTRDARRKPRGPTWKHRYAAPSDAWALLSLDPIIVAGATLALEDEHGRSRLAEYDLALLDGRAATVQSRYVVEPGQCVMLRRPTGPGYVVIVAQADTRCAPEAQQSAMADEHD